jgi:hypothetical protein
MSAYMLAVEYQLHHLSSSSILKRLRRAEEMLVVISPGVNCPDHCLHLRDAIKLNHSSRI